MQSYEEYFGEIEKMYPLSYKRIFPYIQYITNALSDNAVDTITQLQVDEITDEVFLQSNLATIPMQRHNDFTIRDLIRILILKELFERRRQRRFFPPVIAAAEKAESVEAEFETIANLNISDVYEAAAEPEYIHNATYNQFLQSAAEYETNKTAATAIEKQETARVFADENFSDVSAQINTDIAEVFADEELSHMQYPESVEVFTEEAEEIEKPVVYPVEEAQTEEDDGAFDKGWF